MFCKHCGSRLPEDANFCVYCGMVNEDAEKAKLDIEEDKSLAPKRKLATRILILGILALAFAIDPYTAVAGFVLALVCKKNIRAYTREFGEGAKKVSVGKGLSTAAIPVSIFLFVVLIVMIIVNFAMASEFDISVPFYSSDINVM